MDGLSLIVVVVFVLFIVFIYKNVLKENPTSPVKKYTKDLSGYTHFENIELRGSFEEDVKTYLFQFANEGNEIKLQHEPDNKYSKSAIQVFLDNYPIGYVPEEYTLDLLPHVTSKYFAIISDIFHQGNFIDVYITIYYDEKNN